MKLRHKIIAIALLVAFVGSISGCAASKCGCPKFSIEAVDLD